MVFEDGTETELSDCDVDNHITTVVNRQFYIPHLIALTDYVFKVAATNILPLPHAELVYSPPFTVTTIYVTLPLPPLFFHAPTLLRTGGAISLQWEVPYDTGGVPIEDVYYEVYFKPNWRGSEDEMLGCSATGKSSGNFSCTTGYLVHSTLYNFRVHALNPTSRCSISKGIIDDSATPYIDVNTTEPTLPSHPLNLRLSLVNTTGGALGSQWNLPLDGGGVPIKNYSLFYQRESETDQVVVPWKGPFTLPDDSRWFVDCLSLFFTSPFEPRMFQMDPTLLNNLSVPCSLSSTMHFFSLKVYYIRDECDARI